MNVIHSSFYEHLAPTKADIALGRAHEKRVLSSLPLEGNRKAVAALESKAPRWISRVPVIQRLKGLLDRCKVACNSQHLAETKTWLEGAIAGLESEDNRKALAARVAAAAAGDQEARAALGRSIAVNVGHLVRVGSNWIQWYRTESLMPDEVAYLRNFVPQQVDIKLANEDGTLDSHRASPNTESDTMVPLYFLLSDIFVAKLFDKYKGAISDSALATVDISLDLAEKLDALLQIRFTVGTTGSVFVANFVNDGTPASHFHLSPRIQAGNLPAGNIIGPSSNGANSKPRLACIQAIDDWCARMEGIDPDGMLSPVGIHCAAAVASQFGEEYNVASHVNAYTDKVFANRRRLHYNGIDYDIIPDLTISPSDKHLYVRFNLPAAIHFDKPAGSLVSRKEDELKNEVQTFERMLVGQAYPITWGIRALACAFKT